MGSFPIRRQLGDAYACTLLYPINQKCCILTSLLKVIHNELDYRLTVAEGLAMFNVLQARKVPSKLVVFPDENHVSYISSHT